MLPVSNNSVLIYPCIGSNVASGVIFQERTLYLCGMWLHVQIFVYSWELKGGRGRITDKLVNVQVCVSNVIVSNVGGKFCNKKERVSFNTNGQAQFVKL